MDYTALLTVTAPILVAIIAGVFTLLQGRKKATADAGQSIAQGFKILVEELQEERVELTKVIDKQVAENVSLKAEVTILTKAVRGLESKVEDLLRRWRRGEDPPDDDDGGNRP